MTFAADDTLLLIFNSIHRVLRAEKLLQEHQIAFKLMPTPRPLVSDCGLSIVVSGRDFGAIRDRLAERRIKLVHLYVKREGIFEKTPWP